MKFAHLADCHIGSWRDPKLKDMSTRAFARAVDLCIDQNVDFILIAGDLFNTSLPRIDNLKTVVTLFRKLKDQNIPVYVIPGSHDFSPSGKTMLDVLEEAGLFKNVVKGRVENDTLKLDFTVDEKTGTKITGLLGKRQSLEKKFYEKLDVGHLTSQDGYKIFMFHSGIDELRPAKMHASVTQPLSLLPKGFDYYAGGHVHIVKDAQIDGYGTIAYPGPLFPNSFSELEELERGGLNIVEDGKLTWHPIQLYNVEKIHIDCNQKSPDQVFKEIEARALGKEFIETIILIRLSGTLATGKPTEINMKDLFTLFYDRGAYFVMKSTAALSSADYQEIKIDSKTTEETENALIQEHLGQFKIDTVENESQHIQSLMKALEINKQEGETVADFERRLKEEVSAVLQVELK